MEIFLGRDKYCKALSMRKETRSISEKLLQITEKKQQKSFLSKQRKKLHST